MMKQKLSSQGSSLCACNYIRQPGSLISSAEIHYRSNSGPKNRGNIQFAKVKDSSRERKKNIHVNNKKQSLGHRRSSNRLASSFISKGERERLIIVHLTKIILLNARRGSVESVLLII